MVLSTALFVAAGFIFAKVRGILKVVNSIKEIGDELQRTKAEQLEYQKQTALSIKSLSDKMDHHKKEIEDKVEKMKEDYIGKVNEVKEESFKSRSETQKMIMEYMLGLRDRTSNHQ